MPAYLVAQITIHDRDRYAKYEAGFMDIFLAHEGRLLAVDEQAEILEGSWSCTRTVIAEFPSQAAALAWYRSDDYQALAQHRFAASDGNVVLVEGMAA